MDKKGFRENVSSSSNSRNSPVFRAASLKISTMEDVVAEPPPIAPPVVVAEPPPIIPPPVEYEEEIEDDDDDDDLSLSSDSDIGEALDWLDGKDDEELIGGGFSLHARRPNAHGGHGNRPNSGALQPLSNKAQKLSSHLRASPLEVKFQTSASV